jgi:hypothetical protein
LCNSAASDASMPLEMTSAARPGEFQGGDHLARWQGDHRQVGAGLCQIGECAAGVDVQKRQVAAETLARQRINQGAGLRRACAGAFVAAGKNSDGSGGEEGREKVFVHRDFRASARQAMPA